MASVASGLTLLLLLVIVPRAILRALDPEQLTGRRLRATRALARGAVHEQLVGQVVANTLHAASESGVGQGVPGLSRGTAVEARRSGVLHDIRCGTLLSALGSLDLSAEHRADVVVEVERAVTRGDPLLLTPAPVGRFTRWRLRRAFRIRRGSERLAATALDRALDRLRQQILMAVRRGDETEWRVLEALLRDVLLEFPRSVARLGLTFDGAISRPDWFRRGPSERIFEILEAAFQQALRDGSRDLMVSILYTPYHVASQAQRLPAPGLVADAASFYVHAYHRVRNPVGAESALAATVAPEVVEQLFELAERVGAHPLAFGDEEIPVAEAQANLERVLGSVMTLLRAAVEGRDESVVDDLLRRLDAMTEPWDYWHDDPRGVAQRELLAELRALRLAVASWALHLLGSASDRDQWPMWQQIATRLLDPLRNDEIMSAYWHLVDREKVFGVDYSFWFYDTDIGGMQSLDYTGKAASTLVIGLALLAEGGTQISFSLQPDNGWRVDELIAAVDRVKGDSERYAPVYGASLGSTPEDGPGDAQATSSLERVRDAFEAAGADARESAAARTRVAPVDAEIVTKFKTLAAKAVQDDRIIKPLLTRRGQWRLVKDPDWTNRVVSTWGRKAFYTGEPGYVGQDMVATQMGRRAGLAELRDLVALFENVPVEPVPGDFVAELGRVVEQVTSKAEQPPLVICPVSWRLLRALGVRFRGEPEELAPLGISRTQAQKFNGIFRGAPVLNDPSLVDRVLVVDLASVQMEERPTPSETGAIPDVRAFDEAAAASFVDAQPAVFSSIPEGERVSWLREHVLLEIVIAWRLLLEHPERTRAFTVPADLRHDP